MGEKIIKFSGPGKDLEMDEEYQQAVFRCLTDIWSSNELPVLDINKRKYVVISDIHFGDGSLADDIRHNHRLLRLVLDSYNEQEYTLILAGDIEELWQFDIDEIIAQYGNTVYKSIRSFGDKRIYRIYGNHDEDWKTLPDPTRNKQPGHVYAYEGIKLTYKSTAPQFLIVHGHQGDKNCQRGMWRNRFLVRLYRYIEPYVKFDPQMSVIESQVNKAFEKTMYSWAKSQKVVLICGHTHRAIFATKSHAERIGDRIKEVKKELSKREATRTSYKNKRAELKDLNKKLRKEIKRKRVIHSCETVGEPLPCFFNSGCALYTDGVTGLEIADEQIKLVKWEMGHKEKLIRIPYQEASIDDILAKVMG